MSKARKLIKNTLILSIGNLGSKFAAIILVPLYTHFLSQSEFGIADVLTTTITVLTPIFAVSIADAVFRFTLDPKSERSEVFTNGVIVTIIGVFVSALLIPAVSFFVGQQFASFLMISVSISIVNSLLSNFMKVVDKVLIFTLSGIVNAICLLVTNLIFLVKFHLGLEGYLISAIISGVAGIVFIIIFGKISCFFKIKYFSIVKIREMMRYSFPLIPNAMSWWLTNDANRIIILAFVGPAANGLYAVANKIPAIFSMFFSIFAQAWQISAVEEFDAEDRSEFYSIVLQRMIEFSMIFNATILLFLKDIVKCFVSTNFYNSWQLVPFLLLTVMYSNVSSFVGTTYIAAKKTTMITVTTFLGMGINILLGLVLVRVFGLQGVIMAGAIGFFVIAVIRILNTRNLVSFKINYILLVCDHIVLGLMIIVLFSDLAYSRMETMGNTVFLLLILYLNKDFFYSIKKLINRRKSKHV